MHVNVEAQLLHRYAATRSDAAFGQLVERYVNVVHAAARRQVGDADLARDVTQAVFLVLAEKAPELAADASGRPLSGWLLQVTRYAAANAVRARARRARHERRAAEMASTDPADTARANPQWEHLAPLLDEGMGRLRSKDRDVLLLRFFEQKTAREVALSLGISEDAAEKRIARAVDKLRDFFQRRGVAVSLVALSTTLAAHCAEAAPLGLTASIAASAAATTAAGAGAAGASAATTSTAATAMAGGATGAGAGAGGSITAGSIAKGTLLTMASAKAKTVLVAAVAGLLVAGTGTVAVKTFVTSPSRRQVTVAQPPPPPSGAGTGAVAGATAAATPAAAALTFSQGTTIELLAIRDASGDAWWAADGSPVQLPADLPRSTFANLPADQRSFQLILRRTDPAAPPRGEQAAPAATGRAGPGELGTSVMLNGLSVAGVQNTRAPYGAAEVENYLFSVNKEPPPTTDVRVSLGSGIWSSEQRYPVSAIPATAPTAPTQPMAAGPAQPVAGANGAARVTAPTTVTSATAAAAAAERELIVTAFRAGEDGLVDVEFRFAPDALRNRGSLEEKIAIVTADGAEHYPRRWTGRSGGRNLFGFDVRLSDAVALTYQHRPYEVRELRNVSLRPGQRTVLAVSNTPRRRPAGGGGGGGGAGRR